MAPAMLRPILTMWALLKAWFANAIGQTAHVPKLAWASAARAYEQFATATLQGYRAGMGQFNRDTVAAISFASLIAGVLALIVGIVGAVVAVSVLANLFPTYISSIGDIVAVLVSTAPGNSTGDATADAVKPIFGTLIAFAGLFGIVGAAVAVVVIKVRGLGKGS